MDQKDNLVGVVVSKLEPHRGGPSRGYIAMLAVREEYRGKGIATKLVCMAIDAMIERDADEVRYPFLFHLLIYSLVAFYIESFNDHNHSPSCPFLIFAERITKNDRKDRLRNRNHKHRGHETVRTSRIPEKQTTPSILSERQLGIPASSVFERRCWIDTDYFWSLRESPGAGNDAHSRKRRTFGTSCLLKKMFRFYGFGTWMCFEQSWCRRPSTIRSDRDMPRIALTWCSW